MHSGRNRSRSPHESESVADAARLLIDGSQASRITDDVRLSKCSLLLRKAPAARHAVLEVVTRCVESHVLRLPAFKSNLNDIRRETYRGLCVT